MRVLGVRGFKLPRSRFVLVFRSGWLVARMVLGLEYGQGEEGAWWWWLEYGQGKEGPDRKGPDRAWAGWEVPDPEGDVPRAEGVLQPKPAFWWLRQW